MFGTVPQTWLGPRLTPAPVGLGLAQLELWALRSCSARARLLTPLGPKEQRKDRGDRAGLSPPGLS